MIQIFTRRGDGQGAKPFFSAGYGTHQTLEGSAGVSGGAGNGWYSLGVSSFDTAGSIPSAPVLRAMSQTETATATCPATCAAAIASTMAWNSTVPC